jgi:hypothetical protein
MREGPFDTHAEQRHTRLLDNRHVLESEVLLLEHFVAL